LTDVEATDCKKELVIEIPPDVVAKQADSLVTQYARSVRVPGFRPGRAPVDLIRRRFKDAIEEEIAQSLFPKYLKDAAEGQHWRIAGRPHYSDVQFKDGSSASFKAVFEVYPEFELKDYKGLQVTEEAKQVTDEDVERLLQSMREDAGVLEPVTDRAATDGDFVSVSYEGRDSKAAKAHPVEVEEGLVSVGGEQTVPEFSENLRGAKEGDVREFEVSYAADFPRAELAGKTIRYSLKVRSVKHKVLPQLDDDFAKTVGSYSTLDELKSSLRARLQESQQRNTEGETRRKLLDQLVGQHDFPVPEALVERRLDEKMEGLIRQLFAQGIDPRTSSVDWRKMRSDLRAAAEKDVRAALVLERIAEVEKLEVSEEELDAKLKDLAADGRETAASLKTRLTRDGELATLKSKFLSQKALDLIYRNAQITHS
jgi:trigger factor